MENGPDRDAPEKHDEGAEIPAPTGEDDVEVVRAQIEETRVEMSETIDAIEEKLAVDHIRWHLTDTIRAATTEKAQRLARQVGTGARRRASGVPAGVKLHPREGAILGACLAGAVMLATFRPWKQRGGESAVKTGSAAGRSSSSRQSQPSGSTRKQWKDTAGSKLLATANRSQDRARSVTNQIDTAAWLATRKGKTSSESQTMPTLQQVMDENRLTAAAIIVGTGLTSIARLADMRRRQRRAAKKAVRGPFLLIATRRRK